MNQIEIQYQY